MKKDHRLKFTGLSIFGIILLGLAIAWYYPKSEPHPINEALYTSYYRGFNLRQDSLLEPLLGKRYYEFHVNDANRYCIITYEKPGYNKCRGYFPNGTLSEESTIYLELMGSPEMPYPDQHNIESGKYYNLKGKLVSTITKGTGTETLFYPNGQMMWELELASYQRVRIKRWDPKGKRLGDITYKNGEEVYHDPP